jgi:hypothetical protein
MKEDQSKGLPMYGEHPAAKLRQSCTSYGRTVSRLAVLRVMALTALAELLLPAATLVRAQDPSKKQDKLLEHESGFLGDTYAKLQPDAGNSDWLIYFKDFEVFKKSDTFVLDPVKVLLVPEAEKRNIDQADLNKLADYFTKAMKDELQAGHYNLVTEPGPGIMVLRFAITNVEPNGGKTNAVISGSEAVAAHAVVPVPGASMLVPRLKVGRVSIEGQMVDSTLGDVQMAFMTSKSGRRFFSGLKAFQKWGDIDAAFRSWAKNFRHRLDRAHAA